MARISDRLSIASMLCIIAIVVSLLIQPLVSGGAMALAQGAAAGEQPTHGGVIRLAAREPPNLDPHLSISFMPQNIGSLIYSSLVRFPYGHEQQSPYDLTIMPDLAERWEYLDDKTVVFYLRKGVKFHNKPPVNGRELKAHDVKYSLERFATKSGFRARFDDVDRIEAVDDYTVKIVTKHPFAPLLAQLASPSHNMILPKEAEEQYGDFNKAEGCIVTGPVPCALPEWRLDPKEMDPVQAKYLMGFDREEAKRLLAEAGYPKGFGTPLFHHPGYTTPWPSRYELAVDELSKVGIKAELKPQEYGDYISTTYLGKFEKLAMGPVTPFLEVDDFLYGVFYPGQPNNRGHINDPTLNEMLIAQRRELDQEKRKRIVHDLQRYLADKAYYVYIPIGLSYHVYQPHLKGFAPKIGPHHGPPGDRGMAGQISQC